MSAPRINTLLLSGAQFISEIIIATSKRHGELRDEIDKLRFSTIKIAQVREYRQDEWGDFFQKVFLLAFVVPVGF